MEAQTQERRKFLRFNSALPVAIKQVSSDPILGVLLDFSRFGLRASFETPDIPDSNIAVFIKKPSQNTFFLASGTIQWKRVIGTSCEVGIRLESMHPGEKSEVLDYAYKEWLRSRDTA